MKITRPLTNRSRRLFILSSAAAGGGLAVGMRLPFPAEASAQSAALAAASGAEVNHWIVIKPDDAVVIRVARAEMGQGTYTGLAQLVAEELEQCDRSLGENVGAAEQRRNLVERFAVVADEP